MLQLVGTIGSVTIDRNGFARQKVQSRPATAARTLENNNEFGNAASAGKRVRDSFRSVLGSIPMRGLAGSLTKLMRAIVSLDTTAARGSRKVLKANIGKLLGFGFNPGSSLSSNLFAAFDVNVTVPTAVTINFASIDPLTDLSAPQGATHVGIVAAAMVADFVAGTSREGVLGATIAPFPLNGGPVANASITLDLVTAATATESMIVALGVVYFQEVNGDLYPLTNGANAALEIVYSA